MRSQDNDHNDHNDHHDHDDHDDHDDVCNDDHNDDQHEGKCGVISAVTSPGRSSSLDTVSTL